jgi:lipopolysaccharide transport system permease protein
MNRIDSNESGKWTTVIKPLTGWFDIHLSELWRYRDLIMLFVRRDFTAIYKQTVLGSVWFLLQPLFSTIVFTVIFGMVAKIPTDGVPHVLFYMSGIICWNYFSTCLTKTSETFIANAHIFGKVYFPRLAVPISVVITNLITFAIQFGLFLAILAYFFITGTKINPGFWLLVIPLLLLEMAALGLGIGIIISSLTTRYRDLNYLVSFGVQLWMYATPIVYPLSQIPVKWEWFFLINPMSSIVETFRHAFTGAGSVNMEHLCWGAGITLLLLVIGIVLFSRMEKTFMDTV